MQILSADTCFSQGTAASTPLVVPQTLRIITKAIMGLSRGRRMENLSINNTSRNFET